MSLRVVTWNVEWVTPSSRRTAEVLSRIDRHAPEVICLTETHAGLLSPTGQTICSRTDYGYPIKEDQRKVMLWSREPWEQVDDVGIDSMPPGRFVSAARACVCLAPRASSRRLASACGSPCCTLWTDIAEARS